VDVAMGLSRFSYLRRVRAARERAPDRHGLGAQLWAENYDRPADSEIFQRQDVAARIVATPADANGVMLRSMAATLRQKPIAHHTVDELVIRCTPSWPLRRMHASSGGPPARRRIDDQSARF
jgi:hypothetical protein